MPLFRSDYHPCAIWGPGEALVPYPVRALASAADLTRDGREDRQGHFSAIHPLLKDGNAISRRCQSQCIDPTEVISKNLSSACTERPLTKLDAATRLTRGIELFPVDGEGPATPVCRRRHRAQHEVRVLLTVFDMKILYVSNPQCPARTCLYEMLIRWTCKNWRIVGHFARWGQSTEWLTFAGVRHDDCPGGAANCEPVVSGAKRNGRRVREMPLRSYCFASVLDAVNANSVPDLAEEAP